MNAMLEEALALALKLPPNERKELTKLLIDTLDTNQVVTQAKTGAEIVAMLEAMEPIEFVDSEIEDPVEWVKAQRRKRDEQLKPYWDSDQLFTVTLEDNK